METGLRLYRTNLSREVIQTRVRLHRYASTTIRSMVFSSCLTLPGPVIAQPGFSMASTVIPESRHGRAERSARSTKVGRANSGMSVARSRRGGSSTGMTLSR